MILREKHSVRNCVQRGEECMVRHVSGKLSDRHHIWEYQEWYNVFKFHHFFSRSIR